MAANIVRLIFNPVYGLMAIPPCPHEGCGWFMPQLSCPAHGNFGMTFLAVRRGPVTWVKAVLGIPQEPVPDEEVRAAIAEYDRRLAATREAPGE